MLMADEVENGRFSVGDCRLVQLAADHERSWHRNSIKAASDLLASGETKRVQQALHAYNTTVATASTFRASEAMWHALKHDGTQ
jgi:hypothetical protein